MRAAAPLRRNATTIIAIRHDEKRFIGTALIATFATALQTGPDLGSLSLMRIVRFESGGRTHLGEEISETEARRIDGDLFGSYRVTDERLRIERRLAPIVPLDTLCIGLNYRAHATETGAKFPEH